jgi:hypothetical protein
MTNLIFNVENNPVQFLKLDRVISFKEPDQELLLELHQ